MRILAYVSICIVFVGILVADHADAVLYNFWGDDRKVHIRGTITEVDRRNNKIYVKDDHSIYTFPFYIHPHKLQRFKVEDRVRVYFRTGRRIPISVQKLTPVEYIQEEQNRGYIMRSKESFKSDEQERRTYQ